MVTSPPEGLTIPQMILINVVLPAPISPYKYIESPTLILLEIFLDNDLSILPITRGKYIISNFDTYHNFEDYNKDINYVKFPDNIESIDYSDKLNEDLTKEEQEYIKDSSLLNKKLVIAKKELAKTKMEVNILRDYRKNELEALQNLKETNFRDAEMHLQREIEDKNNEKVKKNLRIFLKFLSFFYFFSFNRTMKYLLVINFNNF